MRADPSTGLSSTRGPVGAMGYRDLGSSGAEAEARRRTLHTLSVAARHEIQRRLLIRYDIDVDSDPTAWLDDVVDARLHERDDPSRPWELELPSFSVSGRTVRFGVDDAGNLYADADSSSVIRSRRELIAHLQELDRPGESWVEFGPRSVFRLRSTNKSLGNTGAGEGRLKPGWS